MNERDAIDHRAVADRRSRWIGAVLLIAFVGVGLLLALWKPWWLGFLTHDGP